MASPNKKLRETMKPPATSVPQLLLAHQQQQQGTANTATATSTTEDQPFLQALRQKQVTAVVMHLDHYRSNSVSVSTDYIILVHPYDAKTKPEDNNDDIPEKSTKNVQEDKDDEDPFDSFTLSKKYSDFRVLAQELTKIADRATAVGKLSAGAAKLIKYIELVSNLIDSQSPKFVGKVSYHYVQALAKQRRQIINGVLDATCEYFPSHIPQPCQTMSDILIADVAAMIANFFLTDIVVFNGLKHTGPRTKMNPQNNNQKTTDNPILNPLVGLLSVFDNDKQTKNDQDHNDADQNSSTNANEQSPRRRSSTVVPLTVKDRRSEETRNVDKQALERVASQEQVFMLDDGANLLDAPPPLFPMSPLDNQTRTTDMIRNLIAQNRYLWYSVGIGLLVLVSRASKLQITVDGDWGLLVLFAAYCLGMHTPRPVPTTVRTPAIVRTTHLPDRSGRRLIRRSLIRTAAASPRVVQEVETTGKNPRMGQSAPPRMHTTLPSPGQDEGADDEPEIVQEVVMEFDAEEAQPVGPMKQFPDGAELGSILNCWGHSVHSDFKIRGAKYLHDKKKIPSGDFLFPVRGCDLFLTDTCPSNVGRNPAMFGGCLRDKPTFIINFRLPWGVKVGYYEIPTKFIPFIQASFEPENTDMATLKTTMGSMPPGERCLARFLMADTKTKNKTLKIVPVVVKGPWVVRQVVGGKPAIVGNKLPIAYTYQKAEGDKAMYLEADLDIAASSAARTILSVARTYTQVLTLDLGFVVQGNSEGELPEQMLCGCRLHGIDPLSAPSYPVVDIDGKYFPTMGSSNSTSDSDDGSVTPMPREE